MKCENCFRECQNVAGKCSECAAPLSLTGSEPKAVVFTAEDEYDPNQCPKCLGKNFAVEKRGYNTTTGIAGALLTGGVGLLAGLIGSGKRFLTCTSCGYQ
jgi:hypothetical protein